MTLRHQLLATLAGAAILAAGAPAQAAVTLSGPSATAYLTDSAGGARFRALNAPSQREFFLGRHDLGVGGNRVETDVSYTQNGDNAFSLSYDADTDVLSGQLKNASLVYNNFLANLAPSISALSFNTLQISIRDSSSAGVVSLKNLKLNSVALTPSTLVSSGGTEYFAITGYNFKSDFTLTGDLGLSGTITSSAEGNSVQLLVGNNANLAVPEPATWALMIGGFGLAGAALRRRRALANA